MVAHPGEYRWLSYAENAHLDYNVLLESHPVYRQLGHHGEHRQYACRELSSQVREKSELHAIRQALNQQLVLAQVYGFMAKNMDPLMSTDFRPVAISGDLRGRWPA